MADQLYFIYIIIIEPVFVFAREFDYLQKPLSVIVGDKRMTGVDVGMRAHSKSLVCSSPTILDYKLVTYKLFNNKFIETMI